MMLKLQWVATFSGHNVGDDGTIHEWLLLAPLPVCGGVVFLLLLWWCSFRHVIYNYFIYEMTTLLFFIKNDEVISEFHSLSTEGRRTTYIHTFSVSERRSFTLFKKQF
jgi:hypothetical protein